MSVWEIGRFKLFLPRRINTVLEFSCTSNSVCMHVMWWWWWWWWWWIVYVVWLTDERRSLISSRDHCQRSSPSRISDTPRAGFEPAQSLSSGLVEWSCAVVITTTPQRHQDLMLECNKAVHFCSLLVGLESQGLKLKKLFLVPCQALSVLKPLFLIQLCSGIKR